MTANVSITAQEVQQVIAVPSSAIVTQGTASYVLVQNPSKGTFAQQQVETGITGNNASSSSDTNTYVQITGGLSAGATIATFGTTAGE